MTKQPAPEDETRIAVVYIPRLSQEWVDLSVDPECDEQKVEEVTAEEVFASPPKDIHIIEGAILTAYCPCQSCSEGYGHQTSTGAVATEGVTIAVDPRIIPYGAHVDIYGKEYIAQDTGAAMKRGGCRIDIFMESHQDCLQFGRQTATIQWWEE